MDSLDVSRIAFYADLDSTPFPLISEETPAPRAELRCAATSSVAWSRDWMSGVRHVA